MALAKIELTYEDLIALAREDTNRSRTEATAKVLGYLNAQPADRYVLRPVVAESEEVAV